MKRLALALASIAAAALLALPAYANSPGSDPGGVGLFREHYSSCSGTAFTWAGYITLAGGHSFWVHGHHLVIQSFQVADGTAQSDPNSLTWSDPYTFGQKTGPASGPTVTCTGYFPPTDTLDGYWVKSYDILVP